MISHINGRHKMIQIFEGSRKENMFAVEYHQNC